MLLFILKNTLYKVLILVLLLCNGMFFVNALLDTIYFEQEKMFDLNEQD